MKKLVFSLLALAAVTVMAGVEEPFVQFSASNDGDATGYGYYYSFKRDSQKWTWGSDLIQMHVAANSYVFITNFVDNWQDAKVNGVPDLGTVYNMNPGKYGYIDAADLATLEVAKSDYSPSKVHFANGGTTTVTYFSDDDPSLTADAKGYLLDYFEEEKDIYLAMTPLDKNELMDSYQYVHDADHTDTDLYSRQYNTSDFAGNIRINFGVGIDEGTITGREFVAVYTTDDVDITLPSSGQPLPGLLLAGLLSLGTVAAGKKMKKRA